MRKVMAVVSLIGLAACAGSEPPPAPPGEAPPPVIGALPPEEQLVLPAGYGAEPVAEGLVDPRAVAFDEAGVAYVLEGDPARLTMVGDEGALVPVANGGGNGPWTGVARLGGTFYIAEAGGPLGGRILRMEPDGALVAVADDLPRGGVLGPLAVGPDGMLYVGIATAAEATGAGARDIPCQDIRLQGGERVPGAVPCTGSVLRIDPANGEAAVHAWGFTAPSALAFAPDGTLLVADDIPPAGIQGQTASLLWEAVPGVWYGWPDYLGQVASADPLLAVHPNPPPAPVATLGGDVSAATVAEDEAFGGKAQAYLALNSAEAGGTIAFTTLDSGVTVPFAANLDSPTGLAFSPAGDELWVVDGGSGRLWRIIAWPMPEAG